LEFQNFYQFCPSAEKLIFFGLDEIMKWYFLTNQSGAESFVDADNSDADIPVRSINDYSKISW
jgi:hypothetical protein